MIDAPKILIIEDSIVSAMLMEATINRKKPEFEVQIAKTLASGRAMWRIFHPRIVILDLGLPDSNPDQTLESIGMFKRTSAVLVVSGFPHHEESARMHGADDFMTKGFGDDPLPFIERLIALLSTPKCS